MTCRNCGRALYELDIALTKKLINRGSEEFLCVACLAENFQVNKELIYEKARQFKEQGCILFLDVEI